MFDALWVRFLLTVVVAVISGLVAVRLKVPVGGLVGGMVGVAAFNILTDLAYAPEVLRVFTQSLSGAYIGMRIQKSDLPQFRNVLVPAAIMIVALMAFNVGLGVAISSFTEMSLVTALLSTTPGGVTEISLMSAEMGANQAQVTLMHLLRLTSVLGLFPVMLKKLAARFGNGTGTESTAETDAQDEGPKSLVWTLIMCFAGGIVGYITGLPAGTLAFSMVAVAAYNVKTGGADIPMQYRKYVQMLAGLIIGKGVAMADILQIPEIFLPAILMIISYFAMNIVLSFIISRYTKMDYTTALFSTSPAGPSDMALMAMDLGGDAPKVACMQMVRVLSTIIVFPVGIQATVDILEG